MDPLNVITFNAPLNPFTKFDPVPVESVYVALETGLLVLPLAAAMALIVVVEFTGIGVEYSADAVVGVVPFVV